MQNILKPQDLKTKGDGKHSDGGYLWLYVRGASKSWVFKTPRINGKQRSMGLGSVNRVSLALARKKRDDLLAQIKNDGLDPLVEKRKAKEAVANRRTFAQAAEAVIETRTSSWQPSELLGRKSTLIQWRGDMTVVCRSIADKNIADITVEDIKAIVTPFFARGNRQRALDIVRRLQTVFDSAIWQGWRTAANPASVKMFAEHHPKAKGAQPHHGALAWTDVPAFIERLRGADTVIPARCVEFCILTAARSQEARGARWSEIDFDRKVWTVPASRMKKRLPHEVPLSDQAIELLKRMPVKGEFVFPGGRGKRQSASTALRHQTPWKLVQRLTGDKATVHGFRSAFKDWAREHRIDDDLSEATLAHVKGDSTYTAYARAQLTELRRPVMEAWARFVCSVPAEDNVVELKRVA